MLYLFIPIGLIIISYFDILSATKDVEEMEVDDIHNYSRSRGGEWS